MRWTRKLRPTPFVVSLAVWLGASTLAGIGAATVINGVRRADIIDEMDARSRVSIAHLRRTLYVARERNSPAFVNEAIDDLMASGVDVAAICVPTLAPLAAANVALCNEPVVRQALLPDSVGSLVSRATFEGTAQYTAALALPDGRPETVLVVSHSLAHLAAREAATRRGTLLASWMAALLVFMRARRRA